MTIDPLLPGADLVTKGLDDARGGGRRTVEALLVELAAPRLRALGIEVPELPQRGCSFEHELYLRLAADGERTAHRRYNALLGRLVSCEHALELQAARRARRSRRRVAATARPQAPPDT